ncbi:MAG: murein biosynthesis integral membrane protein MurJ [Dehalococcoidia bacterium]|nr:murein biosynthesis integral membrane protein MurJ [Dehalococcoidia bacterium]
MTDERDRQPPQWSTPAPRPDDGPWFPPALPAPLPTALGGEPPARAQPDLLRPAEIPDVAPGAPHPYEEHQRDRGRLRRYLIGEPLALRRGRLEMLASAAGIVAVGFLLSRLLGVARSVAIANAFGTDPELSAYWVAFRLPDLVFQLLAGATLSSAFIPTFTRVRVERGSAEAWRMTSSVLHLVSIATFVAAAVAFVAAPIVVPWLAPGLGEATGREAELTALAVHLTRLMLLSPLFFGVSGMLTGILNARQHFLAPALAPLIYNLSIIVAATLFETRFGVAGLAWGVVIGSAGHLVVQLPALWSVGMRWTPSLDVFGEGVRDVLALMGPRVIGLAAVQVNLLAAIFFASFVSDEAISALNYAFLMMMLPVGVIGMAISTAVFPTLAQHAAARDMVLLRDALTHALRTILVLAIPASVGLVLLAGPAVRLLLQHGAFDVRSADLVVSALMVYGIGIFAHSGVEILSRGFYALSDTRTPVSAAVVAMILNVALAALLVTPFGLRGLAGAATLTAILEFALLVIALRGQIGGLYSPALQRSLRGTLAATAVMAVVILATWLALRLLGVTAGGAFGALAVLVVAGGAGALAFAAVLYRLNPQDFAALLARR